MDLKQELTDYEIGGIGDIKKHTLRFRSYRIGTEGGKLMIYAEYEMGCPPKVFDGYPSGQELLIDLCNLYQELREKPLEECAQILIRWSMENIHMYYLYGSDLDNRQISGHDTDSFWDVMANALEFYQVCVEDAVTDLKQLYTNTMTVFAIRSLLDGNVSQAQRFCENLRVVEEDDIMRQWYRAGTESRMCVIERFAEKLPKLALGLEFDKSSRQITLQPVVRSVVDAAYYALGLLRPSMPVPSETMAAKQTLPFALPAAERSSSTETAKNTVGPSNVKVSATAARQAIITTERSRRIHGWTKRTESVRPQIPAYNDCSNDSFLNDFRTTVRHSLAKCDAT